MKKLLSILTTFAIIIGAALVFIGAKYSVTTVTIYKTEQNDNTTTVTIEYAGNLYECNYTNGAEKVFNNKAIAIFYAGEKADLTTYKILALLPY